MPISTIKCCTPQVLHQLFCRCCNSAENSYNMLSYNYPSNINNLYQYLPYLRSLSLRHLSCFSSFVSNILPKATSEPPPKISARKNFQKHVTVPIMIRHMIIVGIISFSLFFVLMIFYPCQVSDRNNMECFFSVILPVNPAVEKCIYFLVCTFHF